MSYIEIPKNIIDGYLADLPAMYDNDVAAPVIDPSSNVEECEKNAIEFYTKMNKGFAPENIEWYDTPSEVIEKYGKGVTIYCSYFNINWIYFLKSFMARLENHKDEVDNQIFEEYEDITKLARYAFDVLKNVFGVCELSGENTAAGKEVKYNTIILIKKPELVSIEQERLHSLCGPSFKYRDDYCLYYIEGVEFDETLWLRAVKTASLDEESPMMDDLRPDEKEKMFQYLSEWEAKNGEIKVLDVEDLLGIDNQEQKSKAIKYIGFKTIIDSEVCTVVDTEVIHVGGVPGVPVRDVEYQVLEMDLGLEADNIKSRFIKVNCWSTDRMYVLQVDPRSEQTRTAMGAIAWTCKKPDGSRCSADEYRAMQYQS